MSHMAEISMRELRNRTSQVVARVESGETLTLTVRGRPVADIVPHAQRRDAIPADEFFADLRGSLAAVPQGPREPRELDLTSDDLVEEVERGYRESA
jgi:prevent-host-death family protein